MKNVCDHLTFAERVPLALTCKSLAQVITNNELLTVTFHTLSHMNRNTMTQTTSVPPTMGLYLLDVECCGKDVYFDEGAYYDHIARDHASRIRFSADGESSFCKGAVAAIAAAQLIIKYGRPVREEMRGYDDPKHKNHKYLMGNYLPKYLKAWDHDLANIKEWVLNTPNKRELAAFLAEKDRKEGRDLEYERYRYAKARLIAGGINKGIPADSCRLMRVCECKEMCEHDQGMEQFEHLLGVFEEMDRKFVAEQAKWS
jgi:hypothetical protein